uniref:G_PROTEIN_RECEP_F1_2 domain-containing protein n=1 Tax=Panagrellus redivivus TaxID=6233 RepID=A0A7E4UT73_PANRE
MDVLVFLEYIWLNLEGFFQCSYLLISAGICNVSFWSLPIQAIYRYISVARNCNVPSYFPTLLYMAITTLALTTGLPYYLYLTPIKGTFLQTTLDKMPFWANQDTNKFCAIKIMTVGPLLFCSYLATSQTFGFFLMIWSTLKLNKALQNAHVHLSSKTMAVHAQMTKKMLAQATLPGFIAVLLSTIIIVAIFNPVYDGGLYLLLFVPYQSINSMC